MKRLTQWNRLDQARPRATCRCRLGGLGTRCARVGFTRRRGNLGTRSTAGQGCGCAARSRANANRHQQNRPHKNFCAGRPAKRWHLCRNGRWYRAIAGGDCHSLSATCPTARRRSAVHVEQVEALQAALVATRHEDCKVAIAILRSLTSALPWDEIPLLSPRLCRGMKHGRIPKRRYAVTQSPGRARGYESSCSFTIIPSEFCC